MNSTLTRAQFKDFSMDDSNPIQVTAGFSLTTEEKSHRIQGVRVQKQNISKAKNDKPRSDIIKEPVKFGLTLDADVPEGFRTPFIKTGYRKPGSTIRECISSLGQPSNETMNVWSHVVAFGLFLFRFYNLFATEQDFDPWCFPLYCFAIGILMLMAMSSIAHLFNSMSLSAHHIGFYLDYSAICVYSFGGSQAFFFYSRPPCFLKSPAVFLTISAILSWFCTGLCCASRHRWNEKRYVIRTTMFMIYFIVVTLPFTFRIVTSDQETETTNSVYYFKRHIMNYVFSAFVNVTKLPERYFPRLFDFLGQSHHFLHILAALAAADAFTATHIDMGTRKEILYGLPEPNLLNTFGVFAVVISVNLGVVYLFSRVLLKDSKEKSN